MMPILYRTVAFLVCAVALAATIHSAQAQGILDRPLPGEDVNAKQRAWLAKAIVKRRNYASEEQLREALCNVPEVGFDGKSATELKRTIEQAKKDAALAPGEVSPGALPPESIGLQTLQKLASSLERPELVALPWQPTIKRQLHSSEASALDGTALNLLINIGQLSPKAISDGDLKVLRNTIWGDPKVVYWDRPECIPALTQILQAQPAPFRLLLVERLARIQGYPASEALAQRAIYDLSPQVREEALAALKSRPVQEYQKVLLNGFRWPWRPVVENSADALITLRNEELESKLEAMLREPDPTLPYEKVEGEEKALYVKELVRMNHSQNCLLCHPASFRKNDMVRGEVPTPGKPTPPRRLAVYYQKHFRDDAVLVRADNTLLRQDFSVTHRVNDTNLQRYDYFVRERRATPSEIKQHTERTNGQRPADFNIQREAVLFALNAIKS